MLAKQAKATIRDVARAAGVSIATVSKALNDTGRMTPETRATIRAAAQALQFRPNAMARALIKQRSFSVGLLSNDTYGRFSFPVMAGVSEALLDHGVSVFLCPVESDPDLARLHLDALLERRVDGIIVSGRRADLRLPLDLGGVDVPVVYALTEGPAGAARILVDDQQGARLAAEWLVGLGRTRIVHVTGPAGHLASRSRASGYAEVVGDGLPVMHGPWSEQWGHEAVEALWSRAGPKPDGVFCGSDQIARGVLDALRERGVDVPGSVSVVGFDNWALVAEATRPPLTTIDMNLKELGRQAGLRVLAMSQGKAGPSEPERLPCSLVVRQSCGGG